MLQAAAAANARRRAAAAAARAPQPHRRHPAAGPLRPVEPAAAARRAAAAAAVAPVHQPGPSPATEQFCFVPERATPTEPATDPATEPAGAPGRSLTLRKAVRAVRARNVAVEALTTEYKGRARSPPTSWWDLLFRWRKLPPTVVELYVRNVDGTFGPPPSTTLYQRLRARAAVHVAVKRREMLEHHAFDREAPRPFKQDVMLQSHHVRRMQVAVDRQWLLQYPKPSPMPSPSPSSNQVAVDRQWLLQYPDGRVAMFVRLSEDRTDPPVWVPVLRVSRRREAWMNMRLRRRDSQGNESSFEGSNRRRGASELLAEYELVRTDGKVLRAEDIVREPMMLHEQISLLKIKVQRLGLDVTRELQAVVSRLPTHYRSAGVRVYNPLKPQWKLQLAWALQLCLCTFLVRCT